MGDGFEADIAASLLCSCLRSKDLSIWRVASNERMLRASVEAVGGLVEDLLNTRGGVEETPALKRPAWVEPARLNLPGRYATRRSFIPVVYRLTYVDPRYYVIGGCDVEVGLESPLWVRIEYLYDTSRFAACPTGVLSLSLHILIELLRYLQSRNHSNS
jgi:hypothetical protein